MALLDNYLERGISKTRPTGEAKEGWDWRKIAGRGGTSNYARDRTGQNLWAQVPMGMLADPEALRQFDNALRRGWQGYQTPTFTRRRDGEIVNQRFTDPKNLKGVDFAKYLSPFVGQEMGAGPQVPSPQVGQYPPGQMYQPHEGAGLYPDRFNIGDTGILGQQVQFPGGNEWYPEAFGGRSPYEFMPLIHDGLLGQPKVNKVAPYDRMAALQNQMAQRQQAAQAAQATQLVAAPQTSQPRSPVDAYFSPY